jgi:hypothetical protein
MTTITVRSPHRSTSEAPEHIATKSLSSPWMWMVVACLLLGISGGIRFWREQQFATLAVESSAPPFSVDELPRTLGDWRSEEGMDGQLDPKVAQIAGANDYTERTYLNEKSGDQMTALILYGPAEKINGHMPEICYPAAGYESVEGPVDRELKVRGLKEPVRYRWAIYMKRLGGSGSYEETYHTFYYNGKWIPDPSDQWKSFRYHPGMFRVLLTRPISGLSDEVHAPSEALLGAFIQEIASRLAPKTAVEAGKATPVSESPAPQGTGASGSAAIAARISKG